MSPRSDGEKEGKAGLARSGNLADNESLRIACGESKGHHLQWATRIDRAIRMFVPMVPGGEEQREYEREHVAIPFIYSLDEGPGLTHGEWREAVTTDIGPVLVGGIGFETKDELEAEQAVRVALFMDLKLKEIWEREEGNFPIIYRAKVLRVQPQGDRRRVALVFGGLVGDSEEN